MLRQLNVLVAICLVPADQGLILRPSKDNTSFDCWVDASHASEWRKHGDEAINDPATAKSRSGYVLLYASCPIVWASKLQTEIALSSTEAEYIAISSAKREVIPLLRLMDEVKQHRLPINVGKAWFIVASLKIILAR